MYITVTADDNKYYRTWSSGKTNIDGCTCIYYDKIPKDDMEKMPFYKLITNTIEKTIQQQKLDENGMPMFEDTDEEVGILKPIMEDVLINEIEYSWEFDENAYNNFVEEQSKIIPEKTNDEKIKELQDQLKVANNTINDLNLIVIDLSMKV